jgi:GH43 family beta-xylosidase
MDRDSMREQIVSILVSAAIGTLGHAQAVNPILPHADPFITHEAVTPDGRYVLTATMGRNITLWSGSSPATSGSDPHVIFAGKDGMTQIWSPTIWKMSGHWWVYFTAMMTGEPHGIFVLESDTDDVLGSYTFKGKFETGRPSIDPSLLSVEGRQYLMYVTVDRGENAIWIRKLKSPTQFDGEGALIAEPQYPWEKGQGSTKNYPVNEGPTALYHAGKTFIVYSASDTASPRYCLGLLTLVSPNVMASSSWKKNPNPVFQWSPEHAIFGPGRGTFAEAKDGSYWLLYAAKSTDAPTAANREILAQRFTWNADGSPRFGVPEANGPIAP